MLTVKKLNATTFEVDVPGKVPTKHLVSVQPDYAKKFIGSDISLEKLVERSFDFLLEREPNTSILRRFDLTVISRYFPEYERVIGDMLKT